MSSVARQRQLIATAANWTAKNPVLLSGEIGVEATYDAQNRIVGAKAKVGDGIKVWNNLPYLVDFNYQTTLLVTNNIGGWKIGDSVNGLTINQILNNLLSPHITPEISNFRLNNLQQILLEVGYEIPASISSAWSVSQKPNIASGAISASVGNVFTNLGAVSLSGESRTLTTNGTHTTNTPSTITLSINGIDTQNNAIAQRQAFLKWVGRVRWGARDTAEITTQSQVSNLVNSQLQESIGDKTFNFNAGYPFLLIPQFMAVDLNKFRDADTDLPFDFTNQGTIVFNNGKINVTYVILRGNYIGTNSKLYVKA